MTNNMIKKKFEVNGRNLKEVGIYIEISEQRLYSQ